MFAAELREIERGEEMRGKPLKKILMNQVVGPVTWDNIIAWQRGDNGQILGSPPSFDLDPMMDQWKLDCTRQFNQILEPCCTLTS